MANITQTCRVTGKTFVVNDWERELLKKFDAPIPTLCIDERHRRRLAHRNERKIYNDICDLTGKKMISAYSPDKPFKVYSPEAWWGDDWDPRDYGQDYDFSRPFFEQWHDLMMTMPRLSLMNKNGENSEYCNITTDNKNCYLVFGGDYNEDCMHCLFNFHSRDVMDVYWVTGLELAYDCVDCLRCYRVRYCQNSQGCSDGDFLFECRNCKNCFGCVGLNNKQYHIFNKPYSRADYERKVKEYQLNTWSGVQRMKREFAAFKLKFPHRQSNIVNCENSTGDVLSSSKNCENCFSMEGGEDCKDVFLGVAPLKDAMSSDHIGHKSEVFYEMLGSIAGTHNAFCPFAWACNDVYYCNMTDSCHDCFGCFSMRRAEYCILNKQYGREEYFEMKKKIIEHMKSTGEWGEFPPIKFSPFAYNESVAQDFFPMTKDEILAKGWKWLDEERREIGTGPEIADSIDDVNDEISSWTLVCEKSGRPYQIIPRELKFYRQMEVPIPREAPETRHERRIAMRNPNETWDRKCAKCGAEIKTSYAPERPEIVYCEQCYLGEVY